MTGNSDLDYIKHNEWIVVIANKTIFGVLWKSMLQKFAF